MPHAEHVADGYKMWFPYPPSFQPSHRCNPSYKAHCVLPRRHGNVVTPAWQRCYAGMATLLCRHGNVVMPAWQPAKRHVRTGSSLYVLDSWGIRTAFQNVKRVNLSPAFAVRCFCQNERLLKVQGCTWGMTPISPFRPSVSLRGFKPLVPPFIRLVSVCT